MKNVFTSTIFETPNALQFQMLLPYTTAGSSVHGHVIRRACSEGAEMRQIGTVTHLENWSRLECLGVRHISCARKVSRC